MFREMLRDQGLPPLMSLIMWCGVRWGALGSDYRRPGWLGSLPLLLLVTILTAWLTVPFGLAALLGLCLYLIAEAVVHSMVKLIHRLGGTDGHRTDAGPDGLAASAPNRAH
jgi:hypothetical protein